MSTFFAFAALVANGLTILIVVLALTGWGKERSPFEIVRGATLWLAAGVAIIATMGSLYLSEVVHLIPCKLCWYQRIAMYPLAVILPIAAFRNDGRARLYAATIATIGAVIAGYHRVIQAYPTLDTGSCSATGPSCSSPLIEKFGFVTIPYMALSAFLLILALLYADRVNSARSIPTSGQTTTPNTTTQSSHQPEA